MSVTPLAPTAPEAAAGLPRWAKRTLVALAALAIVAAGLALVAMIWGAASGPVAPAPKSPFGTGLREAGPASAGGIAGGILAVQSNFYRALTGALSAMTRDGLALWTLLGIGFLYGIFHAAGPGHGKAVVASYLLATKRTLARGLALSGAAAALQALVAIGLVGIMAAILGATAASISRAASLVESAGFLALAGLGLALLWRKTGAAVPASHLHRAGPDGACDACGHAHVPTAATVARLSGWREAAGVVLAAGARPCSGAIILLVFALSQGLFAAGIAATAAMAAGTAITTGALAALAVLAKRVMLRFAATGGGRGATAILGLEILAAAFVAILGAALLAGLLASGAPA